MLTVLCLLSLNPQLPWNNSKKILVFITVTLQSYKQCRLSMQRRAGFSQHHQWYGDVSWVVSTPKSPVPAQLHLLALQPTYKAGASALHTSFNPRDRSLI